MPEEKPVLVTGATGNVGRYVVEALLNEGYAVRAAGRTAESVRRAFGDRVDAVELDFTDSTTWPAVFAGVERLFLMRPPELGKPKSQMLPALEYAKSAGVRQMVFLSLQGADKNKIVPHAAIEQWLKSAAGVDYTFIRASFFMQNLSTTHAADIRDRNEIMIPAGNGATAFVDASDVAAVAAKALIDPDGNRNLAWTPTGPEALTYEQVSTILSTVLGRHIHYTRPNLFRFALYARKTLKMPWGFVAVTCVIYTIARIGKAGGLTDDVQTVTGRVPITFVEFAERERAAWERHP